MGKSLDLSYELREGFVKIAFDTKLRKWKGKKNNNYLAYVYNANVGMGIEFRLEKYFAKTEVEGLGHNHYILSVLSGGKIRSFNGVELRDLFNYVHKGKVNGKK